MSLADDRWMCSWYRLKWVSCKQFEAVLSRLKLLCGVEEGNKFCVKSMHLGVQVTLMSFVHLLVNEPCVYEYYDNNMNILTGVQF